MNARSLFLSILPALLFACSGPEHAEQQHSEQQHGERQHREQQLRDGEIATAAEMAASDPGKAKPTANPKMTENPSDSSSSDSSSSDESAKGKASAEEQTAEVATIGGGCFWCTEAVLEQLDGVLSVESGYTGGHVDNPTYEQICSGTTNHAEVVKVTFDPKRISYEKLLEWFFRSHDPTTPNRQGNDVGTQYRSAIFYHSEEQRRTANDLINRIGDNWTDPIVTEVTEAPKFWSAEKYHQDYFRNNQNQGYCRAVILPKLSKLGLDTTPKPGKAPPK